MFGFGMGHLAKSQISQHHGVTWEITVEVCLCEERLHSQTRSQSQRWGLFFLKRPDISLWARLPITQLPSTKPSLLKVLAPHHYHSVGHSSSHDGLWWMHSSQGASICLPVTKVTVESKELSLAFSSGYQQDWPWHSLHRSSVIRGNRNLCSIFSCVS